MIVLQIIFLLVFIYLSVSTFYLLVFSIAGRFFKSRSYTTDLKRSRIAVFIPSYKEDNVIISTAKDAINQTYPADRYSVTVIADSLQADTINALKQIPVEVLEVKFEKSMKSKSLNQALAQNNGKGYDLAFILDADNHMSPDCLEKVNHAYQSGWPVIQCHRTAKNKNTAVAILDAASEEINNTLFRKGHRVLGLSCTLIGSGMAFRYELLKEIFSLPQIQDNPGEDREVDIQLVKKDIKVEYIDDAYIYDEKVQRKEVFEKQRTRWLGTQVDHLKRFLQKDMARHFTITYLNKLFQCFLLPRLLFLVSFFVCLVAALLSWGLKITFVYPPLIAWVGVSVAYLLTLVIAIPGSFYNKQTAMAVFSLPSLAWSMMRAILKIKQNKKGFIHTPKEFSSH